VDGNRRVLAALARRAATGQGCLANTSLFESGLMWASNAPGIGEHNEKA